MLTKDQIDSIAKFIIETAPEYHFLVLLAPKENDRAMAICSNLPKHLQPLMALAFAQGVMGIQTGEFVAVEPSKPH